MTDSLPSLETVVHDFDQWRMTKKSLRERTPLSLCLAAASLSSRYPSQKIMKHLKISFNAFKAFQEKASDVSSQTRASSTKTEMLSFVPFTLDPSAIEKGSSCHITRPDGMQLVIQTVDPFSILKAFLCLP